jgi:predicted nucleotidyltransferase
MIIADERAQFFSRTLQQRLAPHVREIVLFGSRARGDAHEGSDYDFLVILDHKNRSAVQLVREVEVEFLNRFNALSSSLIYNAAEWELRKNLPVGINIKREGIRL